MNNGTNSQTLYSPFIPRIQQQRMKNLNFSKLNNENTNALVGVAARKVRQRQPPGWRFGDDHSNVSRLCGVNDLHGALRG